MLRKKYINVFYHVMPSWIEFIIVITLLIERENFS